MNKEQAIAFVRRILPDGAFRTRSEAEQWCAFAEYVAGKPIARVVEATNPSFADWFGVEEIAD